MFSASRSWSSGVSSYDAYELIIYRSDDEMVGATQTIGELNIMVTLCCTGKLENSHLPLCSITDFVDHTYVETAVGDSSVG